MLTLSSVLIALTVVAAPADEAAGNALTQQLASAISVEALEDLGFRVMATNDAGAITSVSLPAPPTPLTTRLLKNLPALEGIGLNESGADGEALALLQDFPNVKTLWLSGQQLDAAGAANLRQMPALERLYLMGEGITDASIPLLAKLPRLKFIAFSNANVTAAGVEGLAKFPKLEAFQYSSFDWERGHPDEPVLTDEHLPMFLKFPQLKSLHLHFGTRVSNDGLAQVAKLRSPLITDKGLAHLRELRELRTMSLWCSGVTGAGLKNLAQMSRLQSLFLSRCPISNEGLAHLEGLSRLKRINLNETGVTQSGIERLKQALPDAEIDYYERRRQ